MALDRLAAKGADAGDAMVALCDAYGFTLSEAKAKVMTDRPEWRCTDEEAAALDAAVSTFLDEFAEDPHR